VTQSNQIVSLRELVKINHIRVRKMTALAHRIMAMIDQVVPQRVRTGRNRNELAHQKTSP
jgi:hypothetical protein